MRSRDGGGRALSKQSESQVLLYRAPDGRTRLEVRMQDETVWLTQAQMAELFQRERSAITKHIRDIFEEGIWRRALLLTRALNRLQRSSPQPSPRRGEGDEIPSPLNGRGQG